MSNFHNNFFCLKLFVAVPTEILAPKIPKLKIRFGSNSSGVNTSPSDIVPATSPTLLTSFSQLQVLPLFMVHIICSCCFSSVPVLLLNNFRSEGDVSSLVDQNQVMQPVINLEDIGTTSPYTFLKSDGNTKPRKRQPVTKAEVIFWIKFCYLA